ncbi:MAG: orotidine-5'-phosphate decarboxylase [Bacteroidota bacterium]
MTFIAKLKNIFAANNSLLCVGLDTDAAKLPQSVLRAANPVLEFNRRIIEATKDLVCAYKINLAFYESLGEPGWKTIHETLGVIPGEIITIGDAKRGDIGNSAERYAHAMMDDFKFDASTVNAYMGKDCVDPFIACDDHGAFILALTSNSGSKDFQYLKAGAKPIYMHIAAKAKKWNVKGNIGLVVGATHPTDLRRIRRTVPEMPLLIPGVGIQGGDLRTVIRYGCDKQGSMAIINASRSIIYASIRDDFPEAARNEALNMRDKINSYRDEFFLK